jgi:transposase
MSGLVEPLRPHPATWRIAVIAPERDRLVLHLEPVRRAAARPVCGTRSRCVHSHYRRKPWALPWRGWPVQLALQARRFFCEAPTCRWQTFVEPLPRMLACSGRNPERLRQVLLERIASITSRTSARP